AELEYEAREDPAIYVAFPLQEPPRLAKVASLAGLSEDALRTASALIWTTTPWTIPSNLAIAVHPDETYVVASDEDHRVFLVAEAGRFTTVAKYRGEKVLDANAEIVEDLRAAGALVHEDPKFRHEYPHCWRCKRPVIFRATVQWFIRLDDPDVNVRERALEAIRRVRWIPSWGASRIEGMVATRREWVISRQRRWGP